jgi:hypothetical protein
MDTKPGVSSHSNSEDANFLTAADISLMSTKNPFRSPGEVVVAPPSPDPPLPTSGPSGISSPSSYRDPSGLLETDDIVDDLPPPYTPAANVGEETVDLGPRRPFQPAPPLPPSSLHPPSDRRPHPNWQPPSAQSLQPPPTGRGSGFYLQPDPRRDPAPWQTQQQYRQRQRAGGGLIGVLIDTVRDIADVVSGAHDERLTASRSANAGAYAVPYSSTRPVYAPSSGSQQVHQSLPPRPASTPARSPPSTVPDDGSPTRTPVPGHPLLLNGNLLVYPRDHLCVKCMCHHSLAVHVFTHEQVRTRATKTMIPPIHAANVGTSTESHIQVHSHTHLGLPPATTPECNVPCRNSYRPI